MINQQTLFNQIMVMDGLTLKENVEVTFTRDGIDIFDPFENESSLFYSLVDAIAWLVGEELLDDK